jgi:hypothetical protein
MFTDLSVRPVTRLDYAQWLPLWDGYNAFYGRSGPTALPTEITQITWARFFDAYEPLYALVAETNRQLVGLAHTFSIVAQSPSPQPATCKIYSPPNQPAAKE